MLVKGAPGVFVWKPFLFRCFHIMEVINSLCPSGAIWRLRSGPTLAQVMGCCLTSEVQWHFSSEGIFTRDTSTIDHYNISVAHIPLCSPISYNVPFCNRNVHMCAHFCYKMVHFAIFVYLLRGICDMGLLDPSHKSHNVAWKLRCLCYVVIITKTRDTKN